MKIIPITNPNILRNYQAAKFTPEGTRVTNRRDEVTFSEEALDFARAMAEARDTIESRTLEEKEHIAAITQAVRQGTYNISSERVAEKILESVRM